MGETEMNTTQFLSSRMSRSMATNTFHLECGVCVVGAELLPLSLLAPTKLFTFAQSYHPSLQSHRRNYPFFLLGLIYVPLIPASPSLFSEAVLYIGGQRVFPVTDQEVNILDLSLIHI